MLPKTIFGKKCINGINLETKQYSHIYYEPTLIVADGSVLPYKITESNFELIHYMHVACLIQGTNKIILTTIQTAKKDIKDFVQGIEVYIELVEFYDYRKSQVERIFRQEKTKKQYIFLALGFIMIQSQKK